jgi:hypothetical protein
VNLTGADYSPDRQYYGAGGRVSMAIRGRVASFALAGRKITGRPPPTSSIDIVMLIGASIRQEV